MIDPVSLTCAITALIIAILTHIKKSDCWGVHIETHDKIK